MQESLNQRLSIFAGSFSAEAAEAIFTPDEVGDDAFISLLEELASQGKLESEGQNANRRYHLSEEVRQLCQEQFLASDVADVAYTRLVDYYIGLAGQSLAEAFGPERRLWINRLEEEHPNLQLVFGWLIAQGDAERGLRLAYLLQELWFEDQHTHEGRTILTTFLALPNVQVSTRIRAQCLDLAGAYALAETDYDESRSLYSEALALYRELGDQSDLGYAMLHAGHVERYSSDYEQAHALYAEALQLFRDLEDHGSITNAMCNLANATLGLGDYEQVDQLLKESLQRRHEEESEWGLAMLIGTAAGVAAGLGQVERALRLAAASTTHRERIGVSLPPVYKAWFEQIITAARHAVNKPAQETLWAEGAILTLDEAVDYALNSSAF